MSPPISRWHDHDPCICTCECIYGLDGSIDLDVDVAVIPDRIGNADLNIDVKVICY